MLSIKTVYSIFLEALFPTSPAEQEALSLRPETAWKSLPRARNFSTKEACSIFSYEDERTRRLVWSLKYKKSRKATEIGAYALHRILKTYSQVAGEVIVIPMPITKQRRRERGFNQCELLVREIEKISQNPSIHILSDLLVRTKHKTRQTLKTRDERLESVKELFAVNKVTLAKLKDRQDGRALSEYLIIVIDDVVTTGSTMREAIRALREAGCRKTYGLSLAH